MLPKWWFTRGHSSQFVMNTIWCCWSCLCGVVSWVNDAEVWFLLCAFVWFSKLLCNLRLVLKDAIVGGRSCSLGRCCACFSVLAESMFVVRLWPSWYSLLCLSCVLLNSEFCAAPSSFSLSKGWSGYEKNKNIPNDFEKHMVISNCLLWRYGIVTLEYYERGA